MPPFRCYKMQETEFCPFRRTRRVDLRTPFQLLLEMLNNVNGRRPTAFLADPGLSDQGKQIPVSLCHKPHCLIFSLFLRVLLLHCDFISSPVIF